MPTSALHAPFSLQDAMCELFKYAVLEDPTIAKPNLPGQVQKVSGSSSKCTYVPVLGWPSDWLQLTPGPSVPYFHEERCSA